MFLTCRGCVVVYAFTTSSFGASGFCFRGGKFNSKIESVGHTGAHLRQSRHLSSIINARLFSMVMASNAHSFWHLPHPMQATAHAFFATAPLSSFTQLTKIRLDLGPCFLNSMMSFGQAFTQAPQAVHISSTTSGSSVSGFIWIASNVHDSTQSPSPRQPNEQPVSPP